LNKEDEVVIPVKGEIIAYCYMIERGKPAACLAIQERFLEVNKNYIETQKLFTHIEKLSAGWVTLWIYKYQHILDVIKSLPKTPNTIVDHWILGKLFGYDEISIDDFLNKKII